MPPNPDLPSGRHRQERKTHPLRDIRTELRIGALDEVVVDVLLVPERVEPLENKLEERPQVLRRRSGDEDVGVAEAEGAGNGEAEGGGLQRSQG